MCPRRSLGVKTVSNQFFFGLFLRATDFTGLVDRVVTGSAIEWIGFTASSLIIQVFWYGGQV